MLKEAVMMAPTPLQPDAKCHYCVKANALGYVCGATLSQPNDKSWWHLLVFLLKSFTGSKQNYDLYNKELLAIVCMLKEWHHLLEGVKYLIEILTDHQNLVYFMHAQQLNWHQVHWLIFLS